MPRAAVGVVAMPVHAQLRDGGEARARPLARKHRQVRAREFGRGRETRHLTQLKRGIKGVDLRGRRVDGVADARRARVDLRRLPRAQGGGGIHARLEVGESHAHAQAVGGLARTRPERDGRHGIEVQPVARTTAPDGRRVAPVHEVGGTEAVFRPVGRHGHVHLPARAVLLVQLQRQALDARRRAGAERQQALAGKRALRHTHGRRRPQVERCATNLHGRQAVRPRNVRDRGGLPRRRARTPTGGGGKRNLRVGRRIRQVRAGGPASVDEIDGLVEGVAAAGEERAAVAQVADERVRRVGRPGRASGNDEQVQGLARETALAREVVARHAEDVSKRRKRVEEHAGIAHAAECVRARGEAEVEHADARRARREGVEALGRAPRARGRATFRLLRAEGHVVRARRPVCRHAPFLHLEVREIRRAAAVEAAHEERGLRAGGQGVHRVDDALPVRIAHGLHVGVVRREAAGVRLAVEGEVGHRALRQADGLHPRADRVGRLRADVGDAVAHEVPLGRGARRRRDAQRRPCAVRDGGVHGHARVPGRPAFRQAGHAREVGVVQQIDTPRGRAAEAESQNKERSPSHFIPIPSIVPRTQVTSASAASSSLT